MGVRSSVEEDRGPALAAEGSTRGWTPPREVPLSFIEDWRSDGVVPGDGGHRVGEENGKVVEQYGAEVSARWRKHDPSSFSTDGGLGDQRPLHLAGGDWQQKIATGDSRLDAATANLAYFFSTVVSEGSHPPQRSGCTTPQKGLRSSAA